MINETDLRFAFHMDTGSLPMRSRDSKCLDDGYPTSEYGKWLEEHIGNAGQLQKEYQFENQTAPIYTSEIRRRYLRWSVLHDLYRNVYSDSYCFWLEERIIKKLPEIIKNILHI
jgi:hypothetical protein